MNNYTAIMWLQDLLNELVNRGFGYSQSTQAVAYAIKQLERKVENEEEETDKEELTPEMAIVALRKYAKCCELEVDERCTLDCVNCEFSQSEEKEREAINMGIWALQQEAKKQIKREENTI